MPAPTQFLFCPVCGQAYQPDQIHSTSHRCAACGFVLYENQSATASAIIWQDNKLLLVKRARDPRQNCWDFPGGYIEPKEPPTDAVVREVREELGVSCRVKRLYNAYGPTSYIFQGKEGFNCDLYFLAELTDPTQQIQPADDVADFAWFTFDSLPPSDTIAFPAQLKLLADLKRDAVLNKL